MNKNDVQFKQVLFRLKYPGNLPGIHERTACNKQINFSMNHLKIKEMKTKVISLTVLFMLGAFTVFAGNKTEKFQVKGNCGMCEKRIEKAAKSVEGVSKADWNTENKVLEVTFDEAKTNVDKVHKSVAAVGHDTPLHKAKDEVYNKLPGCCKYDRTESFDKIKKRKDQNL
jgi:periplasmic mercuric ion binding protein